MPLTPNGSTGPATKQRRVLYLWYVAVKEDLSSLELIPRIWDELQTYHRDKVSPRTTDSGGCSFPATINLCELEHFLDALECRRKGDNPRVTRNRDFMPREEWGPYLQSWRDKAEAVVV